MEVGYSDDFYQGIFARFGWLDDEPAHIIDSIHRPGLGGKFPEKLSDLKVGDTYLRNLFIAYLRGYNADENLINAVAEFLTDRSAKAQIDAHWKSAAQERLQDLHAEYRYLKDTFHNKDLRAELSQAYWRHKVGVTPGAQEEDGERLRSTVRNVVDASRSLKGLINDMLGCLAQAKELGWPDPKARRTIGLDSGDLTKIIMQSVIELGQAEGPLNWLPKDLSDRDEQAKIWAALAEHDRVCQAIAAQLQAIADLWYVSFKDKARDNYIKNIEVNDPVYAAGMQTLAATLQKIGVGLAAVGHILPPFAIVGGVLAGVSWGVRTGMNEREARNNVSTLNEIAEIGTQDEFDKGRFKRDAHIEDKAARKAQVKTAKSPLSFIKRKVAGKAASKKDTAKNAGSNVLTYGGTAAQVGEKALDLLNTSYALDAVQMLEEQTGLSGLTAISTTVSAVRGGGGPKDIRSDPKRVQFAKDFLKMRRKGVTALNSLPVGFDVTVEKALAVYEAWLDSSGVYCEGHLPDDNGQGVEDWAGSNIFIRLQQHIDLKNAKQSSSFQDGSFPAVTSCRVTVEYWSGSQWLEHPDSDFYINDFPITFYVDDGLIDYTQIQVADLAANYGFSYAIWLTADVKFFDETNQQAFLDPENHPYSEYTTFNPSSDYSVASFAPTGIYSISVGDPDYDKFSAWRTRANEILQSKEQSRDYSDARY